MDGLGTNSTQSWIASLAPADLLRLKAELTDEEAVALFYDWPRWARPSQLPPDGDWDGWLILSGRGGGKTRTGAEWVRGEVEAARAGRIALIAETSADGRDVLVEGESGILAVSPPWNRPLYEPSKRRLTWNNGAVATLYDAREPDQLRGPQHDLAWADEGAKYRYPQDVFEQMLLGLRLGARPRWLMTTTPRPIQLIRNLLKDSRVVVTKYSSRENLANLAPTFLRNVIERYQGTRLGRQEIDAEILDDVPNALWTRRNLDEHRKKPNEIPALQRIVVGVDPSVSSGEDACEAGIVVAGVGIVDGYQHGYVLDDQSLQGSPDAWARRAVAAYRLHKADRIVAEKNNGGEMVELTIRSVDRNVPVTLVHASRGKVARAEPISALYEQGRIHHVGVHAALEDQQIAFTTQNASDQPADRVDACVWALSELFDNITAAQRGASPALIGPRFVNGSLRWRSGARR